MQGYDKQIARLALESGSVLSQDLPHEGDGLLSCPAGKTLWPTERRQNRRLSRLPKAFAVSVARGSHHQAASKKSPAASTPGWSRPAASFGIGAADNIGAPV